jgi:glycosyltransferase involved in cell wall biosynthesis
VCHDEKYLNQARDYEFLINVFIAHNPQFYRELRNKFPHRTNDIFYLPYGINIPSYNQKKPGDNLRVIYASRHVAHKGVYDMQDIIRQVTKQNPLVHWTILGDGPLHEEFKNILSVFSNVTFLQPKTNEEVVELMSQSDVFILPSYLDGLPVSMLEAMSVGCVPVIYSFNDGIREILKPTEGIIVELGDKMAFASAVIHLCNNHSVLKKMSENCKEKIKLDYDITKCIEGYRELFLRFKEFKKPIKRKFIVYGGFLEFPLIPDFLRKSLRFIKKVMSK